MTDITDNTAPDEPREGDVAETSGVAGHEDGAAETPVGAEPVAEAAPEQPAVAEPAAAEPAAPAAPAATEYTPGNPPHPYAGQHPTGTQPTVPQPTAPQPMSAPAAAQPTGPTEPLPGSVAVGSAAGATAAGAPAPGAGQVPPAFGGPQPAPAAGPDQPKRRIGLGVAAAIVAAALIGGAAGAGVTALATSNQHTVTSAAASPQNVVVNNTDSVNQVTAVAAKASPSVVTISVASDQAAGTGSGVVISDDGYVLTNTHVVTLDGATGTAAIKVRTSSGKLYDATVVGTDPLSDLAVIKLKDASGLTALKFADSDKLNVGDMAVAIGAPLGLSGTVTDGIVSALDRSISVASSAAPTTPDSNGGSGNGGNGNGGNGGQPPFDFWNFNIPGQGGNGQGQTPTQSGAGEVAIPVIQTDAAINPGNSGGALLNSQGEVIGINAAILSTGGSSSTGGQSGNIGVGFAIPANLAKRISSEIIANGKATHGLLGASVTAEASQSNASTVGALISDVSAGGAAANAGLKKGDVVIGFNGKPITDQTDLTAQVRATAGGSTAQLTYLRDGKTNQVQVTLGTFKG